LDTNTANQSGPARKINRLCTLLLVAFVLGGFTPGSASADEPRVVATDALNVRSCPAITCDIIGRVELDQTLDITGDPIEGFLPVNWGSENGFVYSLFVNRDGIAPWFREGDPSCRRVALIFDIGVGHAPSERIVQTLLAYGADATMFPMGQWALENPGFLQLLAASGFPIGTHGHGSVLLPSLPGPAIEYDLATSIEAIESVTGQPIDPYFTPYAADTSELVRQTASDLGLLPVGWEVSGDDYGHDATADSVYRRVMNNVYPGAIVELHLDGPATDWSTADALASIIEDLWANGYELVTVPELVNPC